MYRLDPKELSLREESRGRYPKGSCWYAVMAHCGQEERVRRYIGEELANLGVDEILLPRVRLRTGAQRGLTAPSREFLFRSYLFLRCTMSDAIYIPLCDHRFVYRILGRSYRIPTMLDDEEIVCLRRILEADCRPEMVSRRNVGNEAHIVEGPLEGVYGRILSVNSKEARLEVSFSFLDMGSSVVVIVPRCHVRVGEGSRMELAGERMSYV